MKYLILILPLLLLTACRVPSRTAQNLSTFHKNEMHNMANAGNFMSKHIKSEHKRGAHLSDTWKRFHATEMGEARYFNWDTSSRVICEYNHAPRRRFEKPIYDGRQVTSFRSTKWGFRAPRPCNKFLWNY